MPLPSVLPQTLSLTSSGSSRVASSHGVTVMTARDVSITDAFRGPASCCPTMDGTTALMAPALSGHSTGQQMTHRLEGDALLRHQR
jgi:hypothetical protein